MSYIILFMIFHDITLYSTLFSHASLYYQRARVDSFRFSPAHMPSLMEVFGLPFLGIGLCLPPSSDEHIVRARALGLRAFCALRTSRPGLQTVQEAGDSVHTLKAQV